MSSAPQQTPVEETKTPENWQKMIKGKTPSQFTDPCHAAAKASFRCLDENNYDRDACLQIFADYRECKAAWIEQRRADRRAGRANF
ncbi:SubName: Full=Uncharacterized protein {ECO:0000313/EMBL:CCA69473.1} [Serendipita indica DSM 11827]|uniref:Cytochrome c oxidase-assembly factor COX23, mitochondrial n=1 Tax=Serendipita indica (strain DSM 11827) TaxID=1109443 RepID=G4TDT0_SERID|nr:SubName: Full=Uncharacterized protein {ECO:0000313/EMBL:CCA69473.1} [Serendipita indica DSM 11827]CCA69473.1 hypothetical protein PIIN_03373 [Serendipita indica DSM 11827]